MSIITRPPGTPGLTDIQIQTAYYTARLAFQYQQGTKNIPALAIYISQLFGDLLAQQVQDGFDIDSAVGPQLDILGKYIGLPRNIGDPLPQPYYDFSDYSGPTVNPNGFQDYLVPGTNAQAIWYQYQYSGTQNTDLSDTAYQFMLKLKIVLNSNDSTLSSIQAFLHQFLPGVVALVDNANMTLTYTLSATTPVSPGVLEPYLPKPLGVGVTFVFFSATLSVGSIAKTVTSASPFVTVTTDAPVTVTLANGVGGYTYQWQYLSGNPIIVAVTPTTSSTYFSMQLAPNPTNATALWRLIVTDSRGLVAYSGVVSVNLILQEPP